MRIHCPVKFSITVNVMLIWWSVLMSEEEEAEWTDCLPVDPETSEREQCRMNNRPNLEGSHRMNRKHSMPLSYQLLICTVYRLCCGYEWELFTLLVTMWLTHPRPFGRVFPWQQWSMEQCACSQGWNGSLGGCVALTGSQLSTLAFFSAHGHNHESMCLIVVAAGRLFLKQQQLLMQRSMKRGVERLLVILLGLVNYIVKAVLPQQVRVGAPLWLLNGTMLPSAGICGHLTGKCKHWHMTQPWNVVVLSVFFYVENCQYYAALHHTKTSDRGTSTQICHTERINLLLSFI